MEFKGKSVIVTGGGKGIGKSTVELLSSLGADVVAISRTQADLEELKEKTGCRTIVADLSDPNAAQTAMKQAGICDFLVNCAGINVLEKLTDMTLEGYHNVLNVNLLAALICSQEFARMRISAGGGGAIINVTSIAAHRGFEEHLCYAASKAGLEGATRVMAKELGPHNIRVIAVAPTITMTDLAARAWSDPVKSEPMMVRHPLEKFAEPEDVAKSISMLLTSNADLLTGMVLPIDGGFLAV